MSEDQLKYETGPAMYPAPAREPCAMEVVIELRFCSHVRSACRIWTTFCFLPKRMSLILTAPILTSFSSKKSNKAKSPSNLSSFGPDGNAESATGGDDWVPLMCSAIRRSPSPPQSGPLGSVIWRASGRWELAQSTKLSSSAALS